MDRLKQKRAHLRAATTRVINDLNTLMDATPISAGVSGTAPSCVAVHVIGDYVDAQVTRMPTRRRICSRFLATAMAEPILTWT